MDSRALEHYGVDAWGAFTLKAERALLASLPASPAVYIVVLQQPEDRRRGVSDIAYIGSAANRMGLRQRIRQYFHPGPTQRTSIRMKERLCAPHCSLRLGFIRTETPGDATHLESILLTAFEKEHGELPPYNRQRAVVSIRPAGGR